MVKFAEGLRQRMEHKLHVANVPLDTPEEDLEKLFAEYGEVKQIQVRTVPRKHRSSTIGSQPLSNLP